MRSMYTKLYVVSILLGVVIVRPPGKLIKGLVSRDQLPSPSGLLPTHSDGAVTLLIWIRLCYIMKTEEGIMSPWFLVLYIYVVYHRYVMIFKAFVHTVLKSLVII